MLASQILMNQNLDPEVKRYAQKQNQVRLVSDQAQFCIDKCLVEAGELHRIKT